MLGNCLAGESCPFSHDPSTLVSNINMNDSETPNLAAQSAYMDNTPESFPPLQSSAGAIDQWSNPYYGKYPHFTFFENRSQQLGPSKRNGGLRPHSRPSSRHQSREMNGGALPMDDPDAFPSLGAVSAKGSGKKHGKRGYNSRESNLSRENIPASLADVVRMTPSPNHKGKPSSRSGKEAKSRENTAAAQAIPAPKNIPWLETGSRANQQYIKYRTEAIRHGTVRNKFLQR